jgi:tRNA-splicing ligase RtcB
MKTRQLEKLGVPPGPLAQMAKWMVRQAHDAGLDRRGVQERLHSVLLNPADHRDDKYFGQLAQALYAQAQDQAAAAQIFAPRAEPAPWRQWGTDIDAQAIAQMVQAARLPVSVRGALMPDAHVGYGLSIGGVLATRGAVIPYAVGVDIACRMKLTVLDLPPVTLERHPDRLRRALEEETRFGMGAEFSGRRGDPAPREHEVLDQDWSVTPVTQRFKDKARLQLGTSGSGNHFVEFGCLTIEEVPARALGLPAAGTYLALLSHSGSRGTGAKVADYYSRLAMRLQPQLPRELRDLAWLDLDTEPGQEYWAAMTLMGAYAAANHAVIHKAIARHLGARVLLDLENHHNFAWREKHDGQDLIVHRKGATPAQRGVLGIIPGSMTAPAYLVRGRGCAPALDSAAHGAGRRMSRTQARNTYRWAAVRPLLEERGVTVLSAGIDEVPFVYKDIDSVMAAQEDLVEKLARFDPKLVKMAPEGERAED